MGDGEIAPPEGWRHDVVETMLTLGNDGRTQAANLAMNYARAQAAHGRAVPTSLSLAHVAGTTAKVRRGAMAGPTDLRSTMAFSLACGVDLLELLQTPNMSRVPAPPDWEALAALPPDAAAVSAALASTVPALLAERGMRPSELARACGLPKSAVTHAANGTRGTSLRTALLLAAALDASPACLLGMTGCPPPRDRHVAT